MGIDLRVAESDDDLEARRRVRMTVLTNERCPSVAELRAMATRGTRYLIAELDVRLAGSGLAGRSSFGYAAVHPRVLPTARRRGVRHGAPRAAGRRCLRRARLSITVRAPPPLPGP